MPVSPVIPIVKLEGGQRRVLLLTSETALEAEVRDALRIRQQEREPGLFFEFTYLRSYFTIRLFWRSWTCWTTSDMAISIWYVSFLQHLLGLAAATLNIQGSPPLRSRSSPLGLSSLSPDETEKINEANRALEVAVWVAEQALQCPSKIIGLNIIFTEDLGGHLFTWSLFHMGTTGVSFS